MILAWQLLSSACSCSRVCGREDQPSGTSVQIGWTAEEQILKTSQGLTVLYINYNHLLNLERVYSVLMFQVCIVFLNKCFENCWMMDERSREVKSDSTNPGLPLSIQRAPRLLLEKGVGPLESLVLSGQLTEAKL